MPIQEIDKKGEDASVVGFEVVFDDDLRARSDEWMSPPFILGLPNCHKRRQSSSILAKL